MPTLKIKWHSEHDTRVCPICKDLENYTWTLPDLPDDLIHPKHGNIWNIHLGSLAHEAPGIRTFAECRCHITIEIDYTDLLILLQEKINELKGVTTEVNDTISGSKRRTSFEDIGIDPSKYGLE